MKQKTKKIIFRCEKNLYDFLKEFASMHGLTMSEVIRNILIYFSMAFFAGEIRTPYNEIKKKFLKRKVRISSPEEFLKMIKSNK